MPSILITGANRGIGAELARQWAGLGYHVIAAMRHPEAAPDLGPSIEPVALDLGRPESPFRLARSLKGRALDVLWLNAGVYGMEAARFGEIDPQTWSETLNVNALGPLLMAEAFLPHLKAGAERKLIATSSTMGSLAENASGASYAYRASKAALNMTWVSLARDLAGAGVVCTLFCPGWVRTDMGGAGAPLSAQESARAMIAQARRLQAEHNGKFLDRFGKEIPW